MSTSRKRRTIFETIAKTSKLILIMKKKSHLKKNSLLCSQRFYQF